MYNSENSSFAEEQLTATPRDDGAVPARLGGGQRLGQGVELEGARRPRPGHGHEARCSARCGGGGASAVRTLPILRKMK